MLRNHPIFHPTGHGLLVLLPVGVLIALGTVSIHATDPSSALKQMAFAVLGVGVMGASLTVSYQRIGRYAYFLFGVMLVLLALLLCDKVINLPLIKPTFGARRWIQLGPVKLQPSELMKIAFILTLARYLQFRKNYRRLGGLLGPFVLTLVPMFLILFEPDLGTVLLLLPVLFVMLFAAGARMRHFLLIFALSVAALPLIWGGMRGYQRSRITAMLLQSESLRNAVQVVQVTDPGGTELTAGQQLTDIEFEKINAKTIEAGLAPASKWSWWSWLVSAKEARLWTFKEGFQLERSKAALGSGGVFGRGFDEESVVLHHRFLPHLHNDFIFSVIGHQWGFVGSLLIIFCYAMIAVVGVEIAALTNDPFGRLLAVGVVTLITSQALINIGMTIGLMPVTGMTLPFVSYGGSSLLVNFIAVGLLINIAQRRPMIMGPKPFHFVDEE